MTTYIPSLTLPSFFFEHRAVAILLPVLCGTATGFAISPRASQTAYRQMKQPSLHPPGWVFGPVWTALYATMGYTAYRAYTTGTTSINPQAVALTRVMIVSYLTSQLDTLLALHPIFEKHHGATLYTIQLVLNLVWTPLYFGLAQPVAASIDIVALGGTIAYMANIWGQVDPVCGWLLAPYMAWVTFATYLCIGSGILNDWDFSTAMKKDE